MDQDDGDPCNNEGNESVRDESCTKSIVNEKGTSIEQIMDDSSINTEVETNDRLTSGEGRLFETKANMDVDISTALYHSNSPRILTGLVSPSPLNDGSQTGNDSYKNMLLGLNGAAHEHSSDESNWKEDDDFEAEDSFIIEDAISDPLCPQVYITTEERFNLCRPWRRAVIIKLLGRKIGYRFHYASIGKLWNLCGNFELIDLQNDFFVVRFAELVDYNKVMYDGPWTILRHYLTVQRWKPEFKTFEETIKKIVVWIRILDLPIEYYDKHFL